MMLTWAIVYALIHGVGGVAILLPSAMGLDTAIIISCIALIAAAKKTQRKEDNA